MSTFLATLTPMLTLFLCIAVGFIASKTKILPETSGKTMAKMETWIFCPALSFMTMARFCTVDSITTHMSNMLLASLAVAVSIGVAILLARFFAKPGTLEHGVFSYALAFANCGYMGDPIVLSLFGENALAYYKLFCLPLHIFIYTWGISVMTPKSAGKGHALKRLMNAPTIAIFVGMIVGLTGLTGYLPEFITSALDTLKSCMGPVAMLLAGVTIAKYPFMSLIKNKKVYIATALRLSVLPALLILVLFGAKSLVNYLFGMSIGNDGLFLCFFATATPLGLNTVVFPEAYGGKPDTGASMTMISHTLCVITIPILYALMVAIFGTPFGV